MKYAFLRRSLTEREELQMSVYPEWITKGAVYHIYPLGFCGCERRRSEFDDSHQPHRIRKVIEWISHIKNMHIGLAENILT